MSKELKRFSQTRTPARRQPAHGQIRQQIRVSSMDYGSEQEPRECACTFDNISESKQKIYIIENLGCANCAAKMERKIQELPEVEAAAITFATRQLKVAASDPDSLKDKMEEICRSIENQVSLTERDPSVPAVRKEKKSFVRDHCFDLASIIIGAVLFAAGLILEHAGYTAVFNLLICAAAYILLGGKVLLTAGRNILHGQVFDENFLMSIATIAAFCIGDFHEGVGVMLFYRIGEFFEDTAVEKSRSQIMDAIDMRPETVNLASGDEIAVIPAGDARPGDILIARPGDRIPLDGIVIEGESRIDTSPVTGEPVPVRVSKGTEVISGCVNQQGLIKIRVEKPLADSMVTRILNSVENAAAGKPKMDKFITKFARIYTPIVVIIAILTAVLPSLITGDWHYWLETAITFLVISCPCALVISVPLAFFSGIGAASKLGILFKGGLAIEALKKIRAIIMDKTGTLTKGTFEVQKITTANGFTEEQVLEIAASCEAGSTHPIAASIMQRAHALGIRPERASGVREFAGLGIKAKLKEGTALCGNMTLMKNNAVSVSSPESSAATLVFVSLNNTYAGCIAISDMLKDDAVSAVAKLRASGLTPAMLTGDNADSAAAAAAEAGIADIRAQLLPEEKLSALQELRDKFGPVMFVGDGINDAPVLANADVGAAMGSGADAAIEAADVVFMNSSVESIPNAITIAKHTGRIAVQNVVFALVIKLLVILLGLAGFANIWAAVFADTGVAMLCILNSLRILWKRYDK